MRGDILHFLAKKVERWKKRKRNYVNRGADFPKRKNFILQSWILRSKKRKISHFNASGLCKKLCKLFITSVKNGKNVNYC